MTEIIVCEHLERRDLSQGGGVTTAARVLRLGDVEHHLCRRCVAACLRQLQ